ncbi:C-C motif chemokine 20 [Ornithorhynchus anatinus]|uniref:C-C motif chemokine ligand 20 n=1 Tax=Ornithorhynchus anatinus TaxID=9258 RepID=F6PNA7_ORNAN|nr:C-C motif chemokine 20 [Ornithorhynchus anatinus]
MLALNHKKLVLASVMLVLSLYLFRASEASDFDCCLRYTERHYGSRIIKGYTEQFSNEVCDIDAIIFHTKRGALVCANPQEQWVKHVLHDLSKRLKRMSKSSFS